MIIIKILAIVITALSGLLQIGLEYNWKDKRTTRHRNIRSLLIVLMVIGSITAVALLIYDDRESKEQIQSLTFLKNSAEKSARDAENQISSLSVLRLNAEKAASEAEKRELKAQEDRGRIQKELDEINLQIKPLVDLAIAKYPDLNVNKAIDKLSQELKKIEDNLEKTKSITHSFTAEITFYIEANWADGKTPSAPGIMAFGPDPDLILYAVKMPGQTQKIELQIDGMASIKEEGKIAILSYRAKAFPKSWILGQDFREIQGYNQIRATLYNINRSITTDSNISIRKIMVEVFINGQSTAVFNKNVNIDSTLPVGDGSVTVDIKMPELILSKEYRKTIN